MPAQRILNVLGMTPAQWGALPPDVGEGKTDDRHKLRLKAQKIMDEQDAAAAGVAGHGSDAALLKRIENIEASIRGVSGDIERRFNALETRAAALDRGYAAVEKKVDAVEASMKDLHGLESRVKKLEKS